MGAWVVTVSCWATKGLKGEAVSLHDGGMKLMRLAALVLCACVPASSPACLWDSDTLASESARFPEVPSLITGLFARHSREYHQWRLQQKKAKVDAGTATAPDYDDLAVSQHKLGDHQAAIATMMAKEKRSPGIYETYSNLGTFYIYTGELATALKWIGKALAINPNAHFGREKYQRWLVMWIQEKQGTVQSLDELRESRFGVPRNQPDGFAAFVARQEMGGVSASVTPLRFTEAQRQAAIRGVRGMMFFADFDNPILQEAMGDLLKFGNIEEDAAQLAGLCYLHASEKSTSPEEKERLQLLFKDALRQTPQGLANEIPKDLKRALAKGQKLNEGIRAEEMAWIAAGQDATLEFQKKYLQAAR